MLILQLHNKKGGPIFSTSQSTELRKMILNAKKKEQDS